VSMQLCCSIGLKKAQNLRVQQIFSAVDCFGTHQTDFMDFRPCTDYHIYSHMSLKNFGQNFALKVGAGARLLREYIQ